MLPKTAGAARHNVYNLPRMHRTRKPFGESAYDERFSLSVFWQRGFSHIYGICGKMK